MANSITIKLGFANSEETRTFKFEDLPDEAINIAPLKAKILALNASLAGGTSGGLNSFFVDSAGNNFTGIVEAKTDSTEETNIDLN